MDTFTCPKGHTVDADNLKCVVSLTETDIDKGTTFICEAGDDIHSFSLKTAMRKKMFTPEQAEKLRKQADEHRRKYGYKEPA